MNTFQTQELNAQRGMVNSLMHHMELCVGNLSTHSNEQTEKLKHCKQRVRHILQERRVLAAWSKNDYSQQK
eukprot:4366443-Prorocentrum_lima.AAC.1